MNNQRGAALLELFGMFLVIFGVWGWIWNIMKLVAIANDPVTGVFILRCIGILIAPLGVVLGFC